jgi:hypothetical protein
MSTPKHALTILALFILLNITNSAGALEHTSFVYNIENLIFFSYGPNTVLEIYEANGDPVLDKFGQRVLINAGNPSSKGYQYTFIIGKEVLLFL